MRPGSSQRAVKVARMTARAVSPATGWAAMSRSGKKLMITSAIAVSEPRSPARGTIRRIVPPIVAQPSLKIPDAMMRVIPRNHACRAASSGESPRPVAA